MTESQEFTDKTNELCHFDLDALQMISKKMCSAEGVCPNERGEIGLIK